MNKVLASVVSIVALIVAMAFGKLAGRAVFNKATEPDIDKLLAQVSSKLNSDLPMMVNKYTRLDNTMGGPGNSFTYYYTLPALTSTEVDPSQVHAAYSAAIPNDVCKSSDMKPMFEIGITVIYVYRANDGKEITRLTITPQSCGYAR